LGKKPEACFIYLKRQKKELPIRLWDQELKFIAGSGYPATADIPEPLIRLDGL
jgi:hypothetical protein